MNEQLRPVTAEAPGYRWGVLGIIMLGTFMAILDTSIVNVALPHMMSTFGVNRNKIEWVATGFMLASAAIMPVMGWLASRFSYKTIYLTCLTIFTVASALCALAWSMESLVAARVLQAIGAGAIQPIGMSIVAELFEPHERGKALGIWGTGIMIAPALGPTLGGYLTDTFNWRTIFSVNLPIGIMTIILGMLVMRPLYARGSKRPFDLFGYSFLTLALISGLLALSNGQEMGWDSNYIHICEALAVIGSVMFIGIELSVRQPLINLRLFLIRNYSLSIILAIFRSVGLFGSVFLLPIFMQTLMGYTTIQSGIWMMPNAIAVGVTMPIAGRLADRIRPSVLTAAGSLMVALSLIVFGDLDPLSPWTLIVLPQLIRGAGLALMMAPLLAAALNSVPRNDLPIASSFLNVSQNVGGSLGIAVLNNYVTSAIHVHAVRLGEVLPHQSIDYFRLGLKAGGLAIHRAQGMLVTGPLKTQFAASQAIMRKAQVMGYENGFVFAGIILLIGVPLCMLLKPSEHHGRNGKKKDVEKTAAEIMVE